MTLTLLIAALKTGQADFNVNAPRNDDEAADRYAMLVLDPAYEGLRAFEGRATSHAEALLSLDAALQQLADHDTETAEGLVRAAAEFLRGATC